MKWKKAWCLLPALMLAVALPAYADDDDDDRHRPARVYDRDDDDDDRRTISRRQGRAETRIISANRAANAALRRIRGRVGDVDLTRKNGRQVYEVDIRAANGRKYEVWVDARSGRVLSSRRDRDD
ncbi:PepSY domain-containing protein [Neisseria shayeganii]|uniref:Peptidase propeptide and YPEB domain protein n=1 Tax=Neisseria shayeganii 871 TaxID=1032488 RepID=G4CL95_9NEIS|nr:PepSY domain-containing protein [Neisseria shayeganii]EGY51399.1 peptidase propeptide and YPEB domain protein [Neisseria shayeganii 871]